MNAYEIEQIEKQLRVDTQLPLSYVAWADIERQARAQRSRVVAEGMARFFAAISARFASCSSTANSGRPRISRPASS